MSIISLNQILVRFTFILKTGSSFGLTQRSESASTSAVARQTVLSVNGGLKEPVLVLLDHSGFKNDERTYALANYGFQTSHPCIYLREKKI